MYATLFIQERTQSVRNGIPTRSMGTRVFSGASFLTLLHAGVLPYTYRSARSSVGMPFLTLCVMDLRHAVYSGEDAERPERHAHAEHGHESVLRTSCSRCQEEPGAYSRCSGLTGSPDLAWSLSRMSANIRS
ncbi:hypothetical protein ALO41_102198 [Pseudomonas amygdali pv. ulmi]|uniref:Uncharacterized protein n=1 Tax=Pseudomonas amygdali pv. ulmi TaxID=251720 RepID=A0A0Q0D6K9_PSEA0|nr:hypothetical protein ALO41_102198 [Pseudomonas amygdali pv. ulmi]